MALKAVNLVPLVGADSVSPNDPVLVGLRSETASVVTGSITTSLGFSGVTHGTDVPQNDVALSRKVESVTLETVENRSPVTATATTGLSGGSLVITKTANAASESCIYAVRSATDEAASLLGYFKFRTDSSWQTQSPDWLDKTTVVCPYFGLENGQHNTAFYVFFRKNGGSSQIVVGGPLQGLTEARHYEAAIASTDWAALPNNSIVEVWIYFNQHGTSDLPYVELWVKFPSDPSPIVKHSVAVSSLGMFAPTGSNYANARPGPDNFATLYFGNAGLLGDSLTIDDWTLFHDFRPAVIGGIQARDHTLQMLPDYPCAYFAADGSAPTKAVPHRWFPITSWDPLVEDLVSTGWSPKPSYASIAKASDGKSGVYRDEPRIATRADGFMVEAFMSADRTSVATDQVFGAGFGVDDGDKTYEVVTVFDPTLTVGMTKTTSNPGDAASYHLASSEIDWRSRKLVRLTVDRLRSKVVVEVDDTEALSLTTSDTFPATDLGAGKVFFGNLAATQERGSLRMAYLNYVSSYKAWEAVDNKFPEDVLTPVQFSLVQSGSGGVDNTLANGEMVIRKSDVSTPGTHRYYSRSETLDGSNGFYVDVSAKVVTFNGVDDTLMTSSSWTGAGVKISFGERSLTLGFFDCGIYGRKIGVIPGSGTVNDILNQTVLGKAFSASVDWLQYQRYRIAYVPGKSINVYTGNMFLPPAISIPWTDSTNGFDLPEEAIASSIMFGHFDENVASVTAWKYIRFGYGSGQDLAITQQFPNGLQSRHFGGKAFYLVGCSE